MNQSQAITLYQPLLHAIALKMVGSMQDAEDIVQETFLKWLTIDTEKINNTKSYLIKAVTNNCINHINAIKRKKDECLDTLSPSQLIDKFKETELIKFDLENEVSAALNVLHKKLEPLEKGIYVLREVFNFEYDELQEVFDKKKDNCRQLFFRAKEKLSAETTKLKAEFSLPHTFFDSFKKACDLGESEHLIDIIQSEISDSQGD